MVSETVAKVRRYRVKTGFGYNPVDPETGLMTLPTAKAEPGDIVELADDWRPLAVEAWKNYHLQLLDDIIECRDPDAHDTILDHLAFEEKVRSIAGAGPGVDRESVLGLLGSYLAQLDQVKREVEELKAKAATLEQECISLREKEGAGEAQGKGRGSRGQAKGRKAPAGRS